ncbi:GvpL/GvpF family gas vesicle protein [Roseibacterium sp. SDUM158017]|uniref:GvpL/GvpF family gas vesicle protein n=1 Tax=Roseicyclus salinarum TaxID=3036773 RepID=UPI00241589DE|nr:GvpL/GvpF family gas vesicle protein [Roseibacterium sp. SDUM158017]MDG4648418.1 GvpL/GvpF family gas vesicle protein [Roseibacterium sp. SDUM158017]
MSVDTIIAIMSDEEARGLPPGLDAVAQAGFAAIYAPLARRVVPTRRGIARSAAERQEWLERLMRFGTVLPILPGHIVQLAEAPAMLRANRVFLGRQLARLEGRVQFQVTLTMDEAPDGGRFAGHPGALGRARDRDGISAALLSILVDALEAECEEVRALPRHAGLVANLVLLLARSAEGRVEDAIAAIDALWPEGLRFRIVGPSPAVSFASVALQRFGTQDLKAARRLLDVPPDASEADIERARSTRLRASGALAPDAIRLAAEILTLGGGGGQGARTGSPRQSLVGGDGRRRRARTGRGGVMALLLIGVLPSDAARARGAPPHRRIPCAQWDALAFCVEDGPARDEEARIVDWATRQNAVLTSHVASADVLPVKIGAVFSGSRALRAHVDALSPHLGGLAERLAGCVEYAVQAVPGAESAVEAPRPEGVDGSAFLRLQRDRRDLRARNGARQRSFVEDLAKGLPALGRGIRRNDVRQKAAVADWAVLVERGGEARLVAGLASWDRRARAMGLALRVIGPWPAFSFLGAGPEAADG